MDFLFFFAKASDKANHRNLLKKVLKQNIKGKVWRLIEGFLTNRKFRIIANGTQSEGVLSGNAISLNSVYNDDIDFDREVNESIVRCFTDDTRLSTIIG